MAGAFAFGQQVQPSIMRRDSTLHPAGGMAYGPGWTRKLAGFVQPSYIRRSENLYVPAFRPVETLNVPAFYGFLPTLASSPSRGERGVPRVPETEAGRGGRRSVRSKRVSSGRRKNLGCPGFLAGGSLLFDAS